MGAAIGCFAGARLLLVPRARFAPVKTTDDLLVLRSDVYALNEGMEVLPVPERAGQLPYVDETASTSCSTTSKRAFRTVLRRCATPGDSSFAVTSRSVPA